MGAAGQMAAQSWAAAQFLAVQAVRFPRSLGRLPVPATAPRLRAKTESARFRAAPTLAAALERPPKLPPARDTAARATAPMAALEARARPAAAKARPTQVTPTRQVAQRQPAVTA